MNQLLLSPNQLHHFLRTSLTAYSSGVMGRKTQPKGGTTVLSPKKKNAKWTPEDDELLLNELSAAKKAGGMVENGFKKKTFNAIAPKLESIRASGGPKTSSTCQTRAKIVCDGCSPHIAPMTPKCLAQNMVCCY